MTNNITLHLIGHGHIDPTWLWRWTEGFEEVRATFRSALDRMNETPGFFFTASSACFYEWVKQVDPELFEEIRARVKEGRWEIAGGWWIEPDCNIPCGESFVRQGLYGLRFFQQEFGFHVRVGFNPDSFGHAGTLPQILKKLGQDYYVYQRPMPETEMKYPDGTTFQWEASDGSRVLTTNLIESYNSNLETAERIQQWPQNPHLTPGQQHILLFFGVGNHGGGPTKEAIAQIQAAQADSGGARVEFSTLEKYFAATESALLAIPTIKNELQHHARGCYSAHSEIKSLNRTTEHALMAAERLASMLWLHFDIPYPKQPLESAWKDLLYNQFHDILAGTSLESSYVDARDQMGRARHTANEIINLSVQRLARRIDTTPEGNTIVVVNSLAWPVRVQVTASPVVARTLQQPLALVDDLERPVAMQPVRGESITSEAVAQARHTFVAEVPALGYRCYHVRSAGNRPDQSDPTDQFDKSLSVSPTHLENRWWRLELDPHTGELTRLYDKQQQVEVLRRGGMLQCIADNSDTWSHEIKEYRVEAGRLGSPRLAVVEQGAVLATVQAITSFGRSTAVAEWTLYADAPDIAFHLRVDWREAYHLLKIGFDTRIENGTATYEVPYGHQVRPTNGHEEPGQQWLDLTGHTSGTPYGLSILNDGQYSFDVLDSTLRVTVLRSPAYAHHDPARVSLQDAPSIMDQGWHTMRLRLVPHAGHWQDARIPRRAWEHNVSPIVHCESAHVGNLGGAASFLELKAEHTLLTVVKQQEDGQGLVLRGYESGGEQETGVLVLRNTAIPIKMMPHEIKSLIFRNSTLALVDTNLVES